MIYEPGQRPSCDQLLNNDYFETEFREDYEQDLLDIIAIEMKESKLSHRPTPLSDSNSPELQVMPKIMNRDITPVKFTHKHIGTVHLNAYELLPKGSSLKPNSDTVELETRPFGAFSPTNGPPANFLPDLKIKRDEESATFTYVGIRKNKRELKVNRVINKGNTDMSGLSKPLPSVKIVDLTGKINHYTSHELYENYGLKVRFTSGPHFFEKPKHQSK